MSPNLSSRIAAVAAVVLLAACGGKGVPSGAPGSSATSATSAGTSGGSPGGTARAPASPGAAAPGTAGSTAATPGTAIAPERFRPPARGTYRYRQSGKTTFGAFAIEPDPEGTLRIDGARETRGGERQRQVRRYSEQEENEQVLLFLRDGVYLDEAIQRFGGQEISCETEEPLRILPLPLTVGSEWNDSGSCQGIEISLRGDVLRTEDRTVGAERVSTFVLRVTSDANGDGYTQRTVTTVWLSPAYRLIVRSEEQTEGTAQGIPVKGERTEDLVGLRPS